MKHEQPARDRWWERDGQPATLAPHGTHDRAAICTNGCPECGPVRERRRVQRREWRRREMERWAAPADSRAAEAAPGPRSTPEAAAAPRDTGRRP